MSDFGQVVAILDAEDKCRAYLAARPSGPGVKPDAERGGD
jgi:hypothetical protein